MTLCIYYSKAWRVFTTLTLMTALLPMTAQAAPAQRLAAIADAAVDYVRANHPWHGLAVSFEPPALDERLSLTPCDKPLQASLPIGGRIAQRTSIAVKCPSAAGWTAHVSVISRAEAEVLVARRALSRNEQITANDVMATRRDITSLPYGYLSELPVGDALQAKIGIGQGAVITPGMTQAANIIRRGDLVAIELSDTRMAISMRGVALADAAAGELVTVKNSQSGRTVQGQAVASGRVRVQ
ncbi:MAG: flagellar basal body P-ring formation chaperone FlgA [Paraperlucidibaca sp.]